MKTSAITLAAAAALALAAPGEAQQQRQPGAQPGGQQAQGVQGQQEQRKGIVSAAGKVSDVRQVKTKAGDMHQFVKLQTMDGKVVVADLGAGEIRKIEKGDMLFVSGRAARVNDKPVIFARYVGELQQVGQIGPQQKQAAAQGQGKAGAGGSGQQGGKRSGQSGN